MSLINTSLQSLAARTLTPGSELLGRSLMRLATGAPTADASAGAAGPAGSDQRSAGILSIQAASANVQTSLSSVQTADGYLSAMTGSLARMGNVAARADALGAARAQNGATSPADLTQYAQEFGALQDQLRATLGGMDGSSAASGTFNGDALSGPAPDATANLRSGSMLKVINQDSTGAYSLGVSDPAASADIAGALQQVAAGRASLGSSQSRLEVAAATLQIERQNLSSAFPPIGDSDAARDSNQFATANILGQPGAALLAQANPAPATVLNLVQV